MARNERRDRGTSRKLDAERWWLTLEHPEFGEARICLRWERVERGLYAAVVTSVEFDLFTPQEEQDRLTRYLTDSNVRAVAPMGGDWDVGGRA
jgi:hypothetical protein